MRKNREKIINDELSALNAKFLLRFTREVENLRGKSITVDGRQYFNLASNDYLNLSNDTELINAVREGASEYGVGSGGSRLICGTHGVHAAVEEKIAGMKKTERGILFNSGYNANLGIISAVLDSNSLALCDRLNHASIIDGVKLSGAKLVRYRHCDCEDLEVKLEQYRGKFKKAMIITDSIFSMDGDRAPLDEICGLSEKYDTFLLVDEAHATGVFGANGGGLSEEMNLAERIDFNMGTFSKAAGIFGAYVGLTREKKKFLINKARPFIYTTALPPALVYGIIRCIEIMQNRKEERINLLKNAGTLRGKLLSAGFNLSNSSSQIIPLVVGHEQKTTHFAEYLRREGVFAVAIRPPTVPPGTSRIRLSLTSALSRKDTRIISEIIISAGKSLNII